MFIFWLSYFVFVKFVTGSSDLFDETLLKNVLNSTVCKKHLSSSNIFEFYDAGFRIPQSLTLGGQGSLGNYYQCLAIHQETEEDTIDGKYCMLEISYNMLASMLNRDSIVISSYGIENIDSDLVSRDDEFSDSASVLPPMQLALCIPKTCSLHDIIGVYLDAFNITNEEKFCRLPDDKVFSTVDWTAAFVFSVIGVLTVLSTGFDLYSIFVKKKDSKEVNGLLKCFSLYTNTSRLLTFTDLPGSIGCLDGIRAISMLWIICGHSFTNNFAGTMVNTLDVVNWASNSKALWLLAANLAVDTFFMMSGLLIVYTTASKMTQRSLIRNIHHFYLHRLLRMFPLLAAAVLLQASLFHHFADGPNWRNIASNVEACRNWWWAALLHVQNYVNMDHICLPQSWYLSVDVQLHMVSPLLLFFVLGGHRSACWSLTLGLLISLVIASAYCFTFDLYGLSFVGMIDNMSVSFQKYYVNTLTRAPAFVVGMIFGYLLHVWRERGIRISGWIIFLGWTTAIFLGSCMIYLNDPNIELNRFWSNLFSAIMRPIWSLALGLLIFSCIQGYGGPVNWFLSLSGWKFIARISYSLYLFHYPIQYMLRAANVMPIYFSTGTLMQLFIVDLMYTLIFATVMCVVVDAPYSSLVKMMFHRNTRHGNKSNGSTATQNQHSRI